MFPSKHDKTGDSESSDSTFLLEESSPHSSPISNCSGDRNLPSALQSSSDSEVSDDGESGVEVWDVTRDSGSENDSDSN